MDEAKLFDAILATSYTKPDIIRRVRYLREYMEKKFFAGEDIDLESSLRLSNASAEDVQAVVGWKEFLTEITKDNAYDVINHLNEKIKVLPVLTLYLPFEPPNMEVQKLGQWFREALSMSIVLEVHVDPTTLGGCAYSYKGIFRSLSLRYLLDKKRDDIREIIMKYGRAAT